MLALIAGAALRCATSTLLVTLALAAGLVATPTTCRCQADTPHAHSLFGVARHTHAPHVGSSASSSSDTERGSGGSADLHVEGSVLKAPVTTGMADSQSAFLQAEWLDGQDGHPLPVTGGVHPAGDRVVLTDHPPPRI